MKPAGFVCALLLALAAVPAQAQSSIAVRGYFSYGAVSLSASETFKAVAGQGHTPTIGGGAQVSGLWKGLFADVSASRQKLDGQRVFVLNGTVYPLGIPLEARFVPVDLAVGWRLTRGRLSPYAGAGLSSIKYDETSDFAQAGDDVSARKAGALIIGGVDTPVTRWLFVGGEVRYRHVTGVLGERGASAAFGEDQLGGVSYALRVSVGR